MLSTPWGLTDWFADDVKLEGNVFTFVWDKSEEKAELQAEKENVLVRFHWLSDKDKKSYFEFKITVDELTNDVTLEVTDFAEPKEIEDAISLWNSQIDALRHAIGSI